MGKSAKPTATRPGRNGGRLKSGGDHARPGRPSDAFREACRTIVDREKLVKRLAEIGKSSDQHTAAVKAIERLVVWGWPELAKVTVGGDGPEGSIPVSLLQQIVSDADEGDE